MRRVIYLFLSVFVFFTMSFSLVESTYGKSKIEYWGELEEEAQGESYCNISQALEEKDKAWTKGTLYVKYKTIALKSITLCKKETAKQIIYASSGVIVPNRKVKFASEDESIALVDNKGMITAVSKGTVKIDCEYLGVKYNVIVTVTSNNEEENIVEQKEENEFDTLKVDRERSNDVQSEDINTSSETYDATQVSDSNTKEVVEKELKDTSFEEYKEMKDNNTLEDFREEYINEYGALQYLNWLDMMTLEEKNQEKHEYIVDISFR